MGVKNQNHIVDPLSKQYTSIPLHVNQTYYGYDMANRVFDHKEIHPKFWKINC